MDVLLEILHPDFLLRNSVYLGLVVGIACPLVGVFLFLRRMTFLGVALPQVSSCGIACAFAFHAWGMIPHFEQGEQALAMVGSTLFTLGTIALLTSLEQTGRGLSDSRVGVAYVLAGAWSILLLVKNPKGEHGLQERLRGEIVAVSNLDLGITAITFIAVVVLLVFYHKELLLMAYDRELAITLQRRPQRWDALLFLLAGLVISLAVYGVGPLVTFGFLLLPPLIAHRLAPGIQSFALLAPAIGALASLVGFAVAYRYDLPVGATDIAILGTLYGLAAAGSWGWQRWRRRDSRGRQQQIPVSQG
jgi:ABC-type Mn2+/Zn2+ transport system permease subunit